MRLCGQNLRDFSLANRNTTYFLVINTAYPLSYERYSSALHMCLISKMAIILHLHPPPLSIALHWFTIKRQIPTQNSNNSGPPRDAHRHSLTHACTRTLARITASTAHNACLFQKKTNKSTRVTTTNVAICVIPCASLALLPPCACLTYCESAPSGLPRCSLGKH